MSKKRGLSLDRKQEQILKIFHESQSVFQLKELETLGAKRGVVRQSVKDVVQALVDDGMVLKDKIGTSVFFWSLPSSAGNKLRQCRSVLQSELDLLEKRERELELEIEQLKGGREESADRESALNELMELEKKHEALKKDVEKYAENDPVRYETMKNASGVAVASANRWTDNILIVQKWCNDNFPQAKENLEQMYAEAGLTEDFDYVE